MATSSLVSVIATLALSLSFHDKVVQAKTPIYQIVQSQEWEIFTSETGKFSVMMPGTPSAEIEQKDGDEFGEFFLEVKEGSAGYGVFYVKFSNVSQQFSPNDIDKIFDTFINAFTQEWQEIRIISDENIMLNEFRGKEFELEGSEGLFKARLFWVEPYLYMILVGSETPEDFPRDSEKFLDSFQLLSSNSSEN